jgi:hypothetical protein
MKPISFIKAHPLATVVLLATGYMVVPAITSFVGSKTGVSVNLPQPGSG